MEIIEAWMSDAKEYDSVLIFLSGNTGRDLERLEAGEFGADFSGIKFIFPTSTHNNGKWWKALPTLAVSEDCVSGYYSACIYDLDMLDVSGKEISQLI